MKAKFIKIFDDNNGSWELINSKNVVLITVSSFKFNKDNDEAIEVEAVDCEAFSHEIKIYALNQCNEVILYNYMTMRSNYAEEPGDDLGSFITSFDENEELCADFLIIRENDGLRLFYVKKSEITLISGLEMLAENGNLYFISTIETSLMGAKLGSKVNIPKSDTDFLEYPIFASQSPDELIDQLESC